MFSPLENNLEVATGEFTLDIFAASSLLLVFLAMEFSEE